MNIVFFANGPFALPSLDILNKNSNNYKIKAVVTNEDKKLAADFVLNQALKLPLSNSRYRTRKNKLTYDSQFVQLAFKDLNTHANGEKVLEV